MKIGLLALQGATAPHAEALDALGVAWCHVRRPADLSGVDALILPGGESTTVSKLLDSSALRDPIRARLASGMPALGTCSGMIQLAVEVVDGRKDQEPLAAIDITVRRNAFGRQVDSFEADLVVSQLDHPVRAVFIRAPIVDRAGPTVEVLASLGDRPVLCRSGPVMVSAFHPELTGETRIHRLWLDAFN